PADFEQRGRAGGVVVRAVVDASGGVRIERAKSAHSQMVVVRAHDYDLAARGARHSRDYRHDIARRRPAEIGVQHRGRISSNREVLKSDLQTGALPGVADVCAGALQAVSSHAAPFLTIVGEELEVGQDAPRGRGEGVLW